MQSKLARLLPLRQLRQRSTESPQVFWTARGAMIDLRGSTRPGPRDVSPITAVARDLEALLSARLSALGFSGAPRPGVRCYSAKFSRPGSNGLAVIIALEPAQLAPVIHLNAMGDAS